MQRKSAEKASPAVIPQAATIQAETMPFFIAEDTRKKTMAIKGIAKINNIIPTEKKEY